MNRSKIIQAYEARHNTARTEHNVDCDASNAALIFESELQDMTCVKLSDIIDAREVVYEYYPRALIIDQDESSFSLEFKDGSILKVDHASEELSILRLA